MKKIIYLILILMGLAGILALLHSIFDTSVISAIGNVDEIVTEINEFIF